jgi:hypothetical protein
MQKGTFVWITKITAAPGAPYRPIRWDEFTPGKSVAASGHSLPVACELEGILLVDVEVGSSAHVARHVPSGAICIFEEQMLSPARHRPEQHNSLLDKRLQKTRPAGWAVDSQAKVSGDTPASRTPFCSPLG